MTYGADLTFDVGTENTGNSECASGIVAFICEIGCESAYLKYYLSCRFACMLSASDELFVQEGDISS